MEFDEYDYLEKTVENPDLSKVTENSNGGDGNVKNVEKEHEKRSKRKSDERDGEKNERHRSKRSRSKDGSRERDREKSRERRSRHRSRSRDWEKNRDRGGKEAKDRDVDERNGKDKPREKERDKERDHHGERRSRDRERERDRDHRSSSRSERHRSERYERDLRKSKERDPRERERDVRKKKEDAEPEVDPERDQRTVFAYQIHLKADERDVYDFFSRAGKVRDVRLIMDRNSRRSKGVGYIEFYDVMSVPMAIALSGQPLLGQPVMVKPSEAEKNLVQSSAATGASGAAGPYSGGARRLYVGNLHVNITEDQLRQVFEAFGQVELVQLPLDETGHCKGFGFVQFSRLEDARNALSLNGQLELAGRTIKVSTVTDHSGVQETVTNPTDLDDDDGGLALNASTRALLIQRLARNDIPSSNSTTMPPSGALPGPPLLNPPAPFAPLVPNSAPIGPTLPTSPGDVIGAPSECLLLKNMFDPKLETEPEFDLDIKEDVQEECSKFGTLKHIFVDKNSTGLVYLRFEDAQSAMNAQRSLHGRWFAGKMITASFMESQTYEAKFPDSR